ncbi:MAG TPA: CHAT domain-containing tetratricopeptide repeat protein [Gemmataceae bacterium]|nr:CHAT domain-containing tetratricopeptide repeat protein [Gemmataceae bacterium]
MPASIRQQRLQERNAYAAQVNKFRAEGKWKEAIAFVNKILAIEREVFGENHEELTGSWRQLIDLQEAGENWEAARKAGRELLALQTTLHGATSWQAADARCILAHLERMAALDVPARRRLTEAMQGLQMASQYSARTDYAHAEPLIRRASETFHAVLGEEDPLYAQSLNNLGVLCQDTGDYAQAARLFREALPILKKARGELHPVYATTLHNLGDVYADAGDLAQAEPLLRQSLELVQKSLGQDNGLYIQNLANLAKIQRRKHDYAAAEKTYGTVLETTKRALGEQSRMYAVQLQNLSSLYWETGDYQKSEQYLRQGVELAQKLGRTDWPVPGATATHWGELYFALGNYRRAEEQLREALDISRHHLELTFAVQSERRQLVQAHFLRGRLDWYLSLALQAGLSGEQAYQQMLTWKGIVFARQRWLRLERTRAGADHPEVAQLLANLQHTISQLANLAFTGSGADPQDPRSRQMRQLTEYKEQLESQLARHSSDFQSLQALTGQSPTRLQAALPPSTALIDFLEYMKVSPPPGGNGPMQRERHVIAFVVRKDRQIVVCDLGPLLPIASAIDQWRETVTASTPGPEKLDPAVELRRLVWQPLTPSLDGVRAVLVSPDGALNRFPLAALPGAKPGTYLIEEMPVAVVPVPQLLPELLAHNSGGDGADKAAGSLFVVGDVDFGAPAPVRQVAQASAGPNSHAAARGSQGLQFLPLSGTAGESKTIQAEFARSHPQGTLTVLSGAAATEQAFRSQAPGKRYLHIATHGFFAPSELKSALDSRSTSLAVQDDVTGYHPGLLSGLALAGANHPPSVSDAHVSPGDDGILTALEVAEMDLSNAELVVLSACDTGLGRVAGGESLLGLQRAFQIGGARSVIASLWKVDDEVTQNLMSMFYHNLWQTRLPPLQALRQAQLSILNGESLTSRPRGVGPVEFGPVTAKKGRADPRLWAAWVLSGDPGDLTPVDSSPSPPSGSAMGDVGVEMPEGARGTGMPRWVGYGAAGLLLTLLLATGLVIYRRSRRLAG